MKISDITDSVIPLVDADGAQSLGCKTADDMLISIIEHIASDHLNLAPAGENSEREISEEQVEAASRAMACLMVSAYTRELFHQLNKKFDLKMDVTVVRVDRETQEATEIDSIQSDAIIQ